MSIAIDDLRRLRWSLIVLVASIAACAAMIAFSRHEEHKAERAERQLNGQLNESRSKLARARDDEREIRDKIVRYQDLVVRRIIGQEERLNWVEQIARVRKERRLLDLQYELLPQAPISNEILAGSNAGGHEFLASTMRLQMQLLHEMDLLGLIEDLRQRVNADLVVRRCQIDRAVGGATEHGRQPQLAASCEIDWVTLREKK